MYRVAFNYVYNTSSYEIMLLSSAFSCGGVALSYVYLTFCFVCVALSYVCNTFSFVVVAFNQVYVVF